MPTNISPTFLRGSLAAALAALGLACAGPLHAQPYDDYGYNGYDDASAVGGVVVTAPYRHQRSSTTGAPIETVSMSRVVDVSDLDLNTHWGWRVMRQRVASAARDQCDQLETLYPVAAQDNPPCVRRAVHEALASVRENLAER
ncbi:MAG: UrcA family protein [Caulobacteraceae bacterium]|nr:UrcA family protein [Caulobacteraceae bacterium]